MKNEVYQLNENKNDNNINNNNAEAYTIRFLKQVKLQNEINKSA